MFVFAFVVTDYLNANTSMTETFASCADPKQPRPGRVRSRRYIFSLWTQQGIYPVLLLQEHVGLGGSSEAVAKAIVGGSLKSAYVGGSLKSGVSRSDVVGGSCM